MGRKTRDPASAGSLPYTCSPRPCCAAVLAFFSAARLLFSFLCLLAQCSHLTSSGIALFMQSLHRPSSLILCRLFLDLLLAFCWRCGSLLRRRSYSRRSSGCAIARCLLGLGVRRRWVLRVLCRCAG